jgi:hypothetical protein
MSGNKANIKNELNQLAKNINKGEIRTIGGREYTPMYAAQHNIISNGIDNPIFPKPIKKKLKAQ